MQTVSISSVVFRSLNLFFLLRANLELARWMAIGLLLIVISGYRPRIMGVVHWWIAMSFAAACAIPDGGDQVAVVLTFYLLPVALTDHRVWHWRMATTSTDVQSIWQRLRTRLAEWGVFAVRLQVAAIYVNACIGKSRVPEWIDGTALYYWMTDPLMGPGLEHKVWITQLLSKGFVVSTLTWGVIAMQLALAMGLVFPRRLRALMLPIGLLFHAANIVAFGLMSFCWSMTAALVLYLLPTGASFRMALAEPIAELRARFVSRYPSDAAFVVVERRSSIESNAHPSVSTPECEIHA
jgi:antimicrobial peptide system SdpB family protein